MTYPAHRHALFVGFFIHLTGCAYACDPPSDELQNGPGVCALGLRTDGHAVRHPYTPPAWAEASPQGDSYPRLRDVMHGWLWAGGAILASSLLDKSADQWAQDHQGGSAESAGKVASALPAVMALGAGLLYTGIAGEVAASTAETALTAAVYTYGVNLATRYMVGRARPFEGQGPGSFNGLTGDATQSSFASNHVALAFALTTPFAQAHDMPWLYALAATTAFGRVQQREHWVSDTAAGAFMGYAVGSLLNNQRSQGKNAVRLSVTPHSVSANWSFK